MGEVYRARDTILGRDAAIKMLPDAVAADPERVARFRREAETLAALNHPHIATIYGVEQSSGALALVMELVEGPTLADRIAGGALEPAEALPLAGELAAALEAAHERGIVHRDLKPANVKLTADGSIKLLDFGLAKALESAPAAGAPSLSPTLTVMGTQAGVLLGTAAYMSPEQVRGGVVDKRADIWAFGVVLFEMLTGRGLFQSATISDTLAAVLRGPIELSALPASTPASVRSLVGRCLEREPKRRLRDIGEARIAIEDALAGRGPVEGRRERRGSPWLTALPWVATALLALTVGVLGRRLLTPVPPPRIAAFDLDLDGMILQRGGVTGSYIAMSRDGRRIVLGARESRAEGVRQRLYLRSLDRVELTPLAGTEETSNPFFSPDGQWIGFEQSGQLKKVSMSGGVAVTICEMPPEAIGGGLAGATWLDDGTVVFVSNGHLFHVPAGERVARVLKLRPADGSAYSWPTAVPGRRLILHAQRTATESGGVRFSVAAFDLATKEDRLLVEGGAFPKYANGLLFYAQQISGSDNDPIAVGANPFSGGLMAVPIDLDTLKTTGSPLPVLDQLRVFSGGAANYDVSVAGSLVFVAGGLENGRRELAWLTAAASGTYATNVVSGSAGSIGHPRLSADDRRAVTQANNGIVSAIQVHDLERGSVARVPAEGAATRPIFGPGVDDVTFGSAVGGASTISSVPLDGSRRAERLLIAPGKLAVPGAWTRDGSRMVFTEVVGGKGDILTFTRATSQISPLMVGPYDERDPALSPDDRWIAYVSNESGRNDVYVRPFLQAGGRYTASTDGGGFPVWSRDGRRLYYVRGETTLMAVDVVGQAPFTLSTPRVVLASEDLTGRAFAVSTGLMRQFDIARDGRVLLVRSPPSEVARHDQVRLVLDFAADIARRASTRP